MSALGELGRRVMNMVARGVITESDDQPGMQRVAVSLLFQEGKVKVERMQNYGFSGHAPAQSEVTVLFVGGGRDHGVIIATDDRDSRFTGLAEGEVAVYTDEGDSIVLKRDNTIEFTTKKLIVKAADEVTIETKRATVTASEQVTVEAPAILLKGNVEIDGTLSMAEGGGDSEFTFRGNINHIGNTNQTGDIHVTGNIDATGSITAPGGSVGSG
jgi:phage baseplate assembly protein V